MSSSKVNMSSSKVNMSSSTLEGHGIVLFVFRDWLMKGGVGDHDWLMVLFVGRWYNQKALFKEVEELKYGLGYGRDAFVML